MRAKHIVVNVNLDTIRENAERIRRQTGVGLIAVIKADAYGLGAPRVADTLASVVDEFAYFTLAEAREVGKPGLITGPAEHAPAEYDELRVRPTIMHAADAERYAKIPASISVDTGMQRFGCEPADFERLLRHGNVTDVYTHAGAADNVQRLKALVRGRHRMHAACTALLADPNNWLDAVRPGVGLYRGAMRVSTTLVSVRETRGPVGYTGFSSPHIGIILAGYSNRLAPAAVLINGRRQRLLEIGMNSAYVSTDPRDKPGDEVVLLGDGLTELEVASTLNIREHEVLCRYGACGIRQYAAEKAAKGGMVAALGDHVPSKS